MTWIRGGPAALDGPNIAAAIDGSLQRLQTDHIDLLQLHWPDRCVCGASAHSSGSSALSATHAAGVHRHQTPPLLLAAAGMCPCLVRWITTRQQHTRQVLSRGPRAACALTPLTRVSLTICASPLLLLLHRTARPYRLRSSWVHWQMLWLPARCSMWG